ncbi:hypothetical protein HS088_TW05G00697 [Tripterygium wilfordii]|uniref:Uncharacterized protein n=2 Tax=Tripterygium wilfordii TaxID=458696 RepID=A0A7J7DPE9_TRIWF|nr:uncharacterized protein LOC119998309 isoform X1 [Tripterygium wilfordii]KAF5747966.1 hypothetical protein HS088_TW05G00697 [Tripterygium wilfordii]
MEDKSDSVVLLHGKDENMIGNKEETGSSNIEIATNDVSNQSTQVNAVDREDEGVILQGPPIRNVPTSGEVNMEAHIIADDIIQAGGLGARDDIGSFLPVASDSTDFEATIRDAREYEELQEEISRPGLGWREATRTT